MNWPMARLLRQQRESSGASSEPFEGPSDSVLLAYYSSHEYPHAEHGYGGANIYLAHIILRYDDAK